MYTRKIRKCGNSFVVGIPKEVRKKMGIAWGESVIIIQDFNGTMHIFGISETEDAYKMIKEKKGSSSVDVKKVMRQNRQTIIGIPRKDKKIKNFRKGENVVLEMEANKELKISRLVG